MRVVRFEWVWGRQRRGGGGGWVPIKTDESVGRDALRGAIRAASFPDQMFGSRTPTTEGQMRHITMLRRGLFALVTAGALGFGGSQALASPKQAGVRAQCNPENCTERCAREGLIGLCSGRGCYCR